ncbi:MAG: hypothetical protein Q9166_005799 [cf. Caloplaca sp. 2 TL-2023]
MGGFLAPDPMTGFKAFGFIATLCDSREKERQPTLKIRHQNPRLNDPGVPPSRPLPPSHVGIGPIVIDPDRTSSSRMERPVSGPSSLRDRMVKKRETSERHKGSRIPIPSQAEVARSDVEVPPPEVKADFEQLLILPDKVLAAASTKLPSTFASVGNEQTAAIEEIEQTESRPDFSLLRPRLPHQRMHFLRRIGQGGEGHCDLFRLHTLPQSLLAVKILKRTPDLVWHKIIKRKPLEALILQDLLPVPHPNIVQLFGYTCNPRKTMFFYEYCSLGDLQDLIDNFFTRGVAIPEGFVWHVFHGVAKALAYLHAGYIAPSSSGADAGSNNPSSQVENKEWTPILHRDVKPENIFLRPSLSSPYPIPLLADFGLAINHTPKAYECSGTIMYQGPELPTQTTSSDLWSLGATIHSLIHGHPPMIKRAEGRSVQSWEWDPRSRRIKEIGSRGYSLQLGVAMRGVLRKRMEERVGGKRLVDLIEMARREWGGKEVGMENWAFEKMGHDEEKVEGKKETGEKPWKKGQASGS